MNFNPEAQFCAFNTMHFTITVDDSTVVWSRVSNMVEITHSNYHCLSTKPIHFLYSTKYIYFHNSPKLHFQNRRKRNPKISCLFSVYICKWLWVWLAAFKAAWEFCEPIKINISFNWGLFAVATPKQNQQNHNTAHHHHLRLTAFTKGHYLRIVPQLIVFYRMLNSAPADMRMYSYIWMGSAWDEETFSSYGLSKQEIATCVTAWDYGQLLILSQALITQGTTIKYKLRSRIAPVQ